MEHVPGISLQKAWHSMEPKQQFDCTRILSKWLTEMARLDFPAYGSLYFDGAISPDSAISIGNGFLIGASCASILWNCGSLESSLYRESKIYHGPCEYALTLYGNN